MCGEQRQLDDEFHFTLESPPRVRGTAVSPPAANFADRITPACAGNSSASSRASFSIWDHPRVCGEQNGEIAAFMDIEGSPPRVRGTGKIEENGE